MQLSVALTNGLLADQSVMGQIEIGIQEGGGGLERDAMAVAEKYMRTWIDQKWAGILAQLGQHANV